MKKIVQRLEPSYTPSTGDSFELPSTQKVEGAPIGKLFLDGRGLSTAMFWIAFFMCLFMVYALSSWLTKLMAQAGYSLGSALTFVLVLNFGAMIGAIGGGWLAARFSIKKVVMCFFALAAVSITLLGVKMPTEALFFVVGLAGASTIGTQILIYAYVGQYYPMAIRSTAIGFASGVGHPLLFPADPHECFELTAQAFDLAERLQTPVMVMTDLDLGMNDHMCQPFAWDADRKFDRGKVLSKEDLDRLEKWGRYLDVDGDGICYRTLPGTHPTKGAYFARGTSRDEYARYSDSEHAYKRNMDRLLVKWETIKKLMPKPYFYQNEPASPYGMIFFGTTTLAAEEVLDRAKQDWSRRVFNSFIFLLKFGISK